VAATLEELAHAKSEAEKQLAAIEKQGELLRQALLRAEAVAQDTIAKAQEEAAAIRREAEAEAQHERQAVENRLQQLEEEIAAYRRTVSERFYSCERELRALLDRFYLLVRRHVEALDREITSEVQSLVCRLETEIAQIPKPTPERITIAAAAAIEGDATQPSTWQEKEEALLVGCVLQNDLHDPAGNVVAPKGTVVTPELVASAVEKGLYGELVAAVQEPTGKVTE